MTDYKPNGNGPTRRYFAKPKYGQFCTGKNLVIDYKNTDLLMRFLTETGKIRHRRQTGTFAKQQRGVAQPIKSAPHPAPLPFPRHVWSHSNS